MASSPSSTIFSFVRFIRNQLKKDFQGINHETIKGFKDDDKAEDMVSKISEHTQGLIQVTRLSRKYPSVIDNKIDDDDLAVLLTKGHLYDRSFSVDVQEIEEEL